MAMSLAAPVIRNEPEGPLSPDMGVTTASVITFSAARSGYSIRLNRNLYKPTFKE